MVTKQKIKKLDKSKTAKKNQHQLRNYRTRGESDEALYQVSETRRKLEVGSTKVVESHFGEQENAVLLNLNLLNEFTIFSIII